MLKNVNNMACRDGKSKICKTVPPCVLTIINGDDQEATLIGNEKQIKMAVILNFAN